MPQKAINLYYLCTFVRFKISILLIVVFASGIVFSQSDSTYFISYYDNIVPRLGYTYKQQDIYLDSYVTKTSYNSENFGTGPQYFIGGDVGHKWLTLGYGFGQNKQNTRQNMDLRFSTTYKPLSLHANFTRLNNLKYNYFDTLLVTKHTFKPINNSFSSLGIKLDYIFNYKKFCYSAGFSQGGKQIKRKGSFIATTAYSRNGFIIGDIPSDLNRDSIVFNVLKIKGINSHLVEVGGGYAYNWVIEKDYLIAISEIPGLGMQWLNVKSQEEGIKKYQRVSFVNYFKLGFVWHIKRLFLGFSFYSNLWYSEVDKFDYRQHNTGTFAYFGWVFDEPKRFLKNTRSQ